MTMQASSWALGVWLAAAVAPPAVAPPAEPETPAYAAPEATADVETILTDTSKAYLRARARLEAHPELAAAALRDKLDAVPAPGPSQQRRLLGVLAELRAPEDLPRFAAVLRRTAVNAAPGADPVDLVHPWRTLLVDQGAAAIEHIQPLVGDTALPIELRVALLGDMVDLQPAATAGQLVVLVGRGQSELEGALQRRLTARCKRDAPARRSVLAATDAALDAALGEAPAQAETGRLPALLRFRARVGDDPDALALRLAAVAGQDDARFVVRVAAIRGLGQLVGQPGQGTSEATSEATAALRRSASAQLQAAKTGSQRGEILGWLSLQGLPEADAAALSEQFSLRGSDAPRLATIGFRVAPRGTGHPWLAAAMDNPWPQVRQAALERIDAPCDPPTVDILSSRGNATDAGGDTDRSAARAAVAGLGRCATPRSSKALRTILVNTRGDVELRAEAARQLSRLGETDPVVKLLRSRPDPALARRLAAALRHAPASTEAVDETLCAYLEMTGPVARASADTLRALHPGERLPCSQ